MESITLGYWKDRWLGIMVQYMLEICKLNYVYKQYEVGDPPEYSKKEWTDEKYLLGLDFPNLPYLIDGDIKITETLPIMRYLARKYKPEMLGTTIEKQTLADMLANVIFNAYWETWIIAYDKEDGLQDYLQTSYTKLEPISKFLGEKLFLIGDQVTYVDIFLYEYINTIKAFEKDEKFMSLYPNLNDLHSRVESITEIKEFISSERFVRLQFFNKYAKNNTS